MKTSTQTFNQALTSKNYSWKVAGYDLTRAVVAGGIGYGMSALLEYQGVSPVVVAMVLSTSPSVLNYMATQVERKVLAEAPKTSATSLEEGEALMSGVNKGIAPQPSRWVKARNFGSGKLMGVVLPSNAAAGVAAGVTELAGLPRLASQSLAAGLSGLFSTYGNRKERLHELAVQEANRALTIINYRS